MIKLPTTMKRLLPIIAILFVACNTTTKSTDEILAEVWAKDQTIRQQMLELTKAVTAEQRTDLIDSLITTNEALGRIDEENMAVVDSILQQGVPNNLSEESYKTIWIVIDHASLEKQEQYLPLVEQMSLNGQVANDEYATLFDRVAMKRNRPQRYGSQAVQFGSPDNMQLYIWPVENPAGLDSLRLSVGMKPLADYLKQLTETTTIEAKYDPTLTIDQINTLQQGE